MKKIGDLWKVLKSRWRNHMPVFFRRMMWLGGLMCGIAIAVHEIFARYGIQADDWWICIERYLMGGGAGIAFACKFTQEYGKDGQPIQKGLEPQEPKALNNCDVEATQPGEEYTITNE